MLRKKNQIKERDEMTGILFSNRLYERLLWSFRSHIWVKRESNTNDWEWNILNQGNSICESPDRTYLACLWNMKEALYLGQSENSDRQSMTGTYHHAWLCFVEMVWELLFTQVVFQLQSSKFLSPELTGVTGMSHHAQRP
jgi:hypothetical protein